MLVESLAVQSGHMTGKVLRGGDATQHIGRVKMSANFKCVRPRVVKNTLAPQLAHFQVLEGAAASPLKDTPTCARIGVVLHHCIRRE